MVRKLTEVLKITPGTTNCPVELPIAMRMEKISPISLDLLQPLEYLAQHGELKGIDLRRARLQEVRKYLACRFGSLDDFSQYVEDTRLRVEEEKRSKATAAAIAKAWAAKQIQDARQTAQEAADISKCSCGNNFNRKCSHKKCGNCCPGVGCPKHKKKRNAN
jgi:hypothetical protein